MISEDQKKDLSRLLMEHTYLKKDCLKRLYDVYDGHQVGWDRHYHTTEHIYHMVTNMAANCPHELWIAVVFHDYMYHPQGKDNEYQSVIQYLRAYSHFNNIDHDKVVSMILATRDHELVTDCVSERIFLNLDNHILASDYRSYSSYVLKIEKEYLPFFKYEEFNEGRMQFLESYLAKKQLFFTAPNIYHSTRVQYLTDAAHSNMDKELTERRSLTKGMHYLQLDKVAK